MAPWPGRPRQQAAAAVADGVQLLAAGQRQEDEIGRRRAGRLGPPPFSFQYNELLDREGPTGGKPQIPGVCRVHYRAPTEGGSSGSPVFNARLWEVIALHHKGGKIGMPKLNGVPGEYAANEGVSLQSIKEALVQR